MHHWVFKCKLKVEGTNPDNGSCYDYICKIKIPLPRTYEKANAKAVQIKEQIRKALKNGNTKFFKDLDEKYSQSDHSIQLDEGFTVVEIKITNYKKFKLPSIPKKN